VAVRRNALLAAPPPDRQRLACRGPPRRACRPSPP
jgi:hypothetical protein